MRNPVLSGKRRIGGVHENDNTYPELRNGSVSTHLLLGPKWWCSDTHRNAPGRGARIYGIVNSVHCFYASIFARNRSNQHPNQRDSPRNRYRHTPPARQWLHRLNDTFAEGSLAHQGRTTIFSAERERGEGAAEAAGGTKQGRGRPGACPHFWSAVECKNAPQLE